MRLNYTIRSTYTIRPILYNINLYYETYTKDLYYNIDLYYNYNTYTGTTRLITIYNIDLYYMTLILYNTYTMRLILWDLYYKINLY